MITFCCAQLHCVLASILDHLPRFPGERERSALLHLRLLRRTALLRVARRRIFLLVALPMLSLAGLPAQAKTYTFSSTAVPLGCTAVSGNYTCSAAALSLADGDKIIIESPKPATITVNGALTTGANTFINSGGDASDLKFVVNGALTLGANTILKANVTSSAAISVGAGSRVSGDITTAVGAVTLGDKVDVGGNISTASGAITIGDKSTVHGSISSSIAGAITLTGKVDVRGSISTASGAITIGDKSEVGGSVSTTIAGAITLGDKSSVDSVCCPGHDAICVTNNSGKHMPTVCSATPPTGSSTPGAFACLETGAILNAADNPLYTKLVNTSFHFDIAALKTDHTLETNYVATGGTAKTVTVELVDGSGPDTTACASRTALSPAVSQTLNFAAADSGRKTTSDMNINNAYANLRCRVTDNSQSPSVMACSTDNFSVRPQQFTVTAPTMSNNGLTGTPKDIAGNAFTLNAAASVSSGYSGTSPVLITTKVYDHNAVPIAPGTLSGLFAAGSGSGAQGTAFKYLDVGNIRFLADAVVDSKFTKVDKDKVDQPDDCIANSTSNDISGDKYGCNIGSAASATLGRWYPSHYSFVGTLTTSCVAGGFTYMDNDGLGVALTLKAHVSTGATPSASDPVASRYTSGYTNLADVTISGDNNGSPVAVTRLENPTFPVMPNTTLWTAGQWTINDTYKFAKLVTPDGPYDMFKLKAALSDPDASALIGTATEQETGITRIRYGQLKMQNAYGTELLALPIPLQAQYWNGTIYVPNTADSCTVIPMSSITMGNYRKQLNACETQLSPVGNVTMVAGKLPGTGLLLTKPGANNAGSVDLAINLSATTAGNTCVSGTESVATAANMPWFGFNPRSRATFGVYKSVFIYIREMY
ncbi:MAG: DUF6701 domain-containing protein [Burkholderiaceae bacterium]